MEYVAYLLSGLTVVLISIFKYSRTPLRDIPGPKPFPIIGNTFQLNMDKLYINLADLAKQYGVVYKLYLWRKPVVVVNDYHHIHHVLVKQSADFAGRPDTYRCGVVRENLLAIILSDPSREQRARRKVMQSFLKQYGAGIQKIEDITQTATDDLMARLAELNGSARDVRELIYHCLTDVMLILLTGQAANKEEIQEMKDILDDHSYIQGAGYGALLDMFPLIRFLGNDIYAKILHVIKTKERLVNRWMKSSPTDGFISNVMAMSDTDKKLHFLDTFKAQSKMAWSFFVAGVSTTSNTLTCVLQALCCSTGVQDKARQEIMDVIGPSRHPTLKDQDLMPYLKAVILEANRLYTPSALSVPHKCVTTCKLGEYTIPKGTEVWINIWALHHDEKFWDEPFKFKPERFLDADGQLVAADHPNRKNLMPFGAGNRVCVGEVLAMSRMFLITARILQHFTILPDKEKQSTCEPTDMKMGIVLIPAEYRVRMVPV